MVGPILLTVDLDEAKENVGKRLEFIEAEVHKVDASIGKSHDIVKLKWLIDFYCWQIVQPELIIHLPRP